MGGYNGGGNVGKAFTSTTGYYSSGGGGGVSWGVPGGSGYIGNSLLSNKIMYCYNCTTSNNTNTKTVSTTNKIF